MRCSSANARRGRRVGRARRACPRSTTRPSSRTTIASQRARRGDAVGDEDHRALAPPGARSRRGSRPRSSRRPRRADRRGRAPAARRTSARASAMRCFCPPESCTPRSPTTVSKPSGSDSISSSTCASRAASRIASSAPRRVAARRARSRCCARPSSRRGTRPAARSRCSRARVASGSSQTSSPSRNTRRRAASAGGARGARRAWSCPSRCARRWRATLPARHLEAHVRRAPCARRTRSDRSSTLERALHLLGRGQRRRRRPRAPRRRSSCRRA